MPNSTFILAVNTEVSQGLKWDLQELVQHGEMTHLEMSHKVICTVSSSRFVSFVDRLWSADKCCCCWARGTALSRFTPPYFPIYSTVQKFQNMCKHTWRFYNLKAWKSIFDLLFFTASWTLSGELSCNVCNKSLWIVLQALWRTFKPHLWMLAAFCTILSQNYPTLFQ